MRVSIISFTERGAELADRIADSLYADGDEAICSRGFGEDKVARTVWAEHEWNRSDALVFVGATGIAVRTVAPLLVHKSKDPAVVVVDERGLHCISLLSGHIGGANELTLRIAQGIGSDPVITTATDVNDAFAIDSWAVSQGMLVKNPSRIKDVSSALLRGEDVKVWSEVEIDGEPPEHVVMIDVPDGADAMVSFQTWVPMEGAASLPLLLVPRVLVAGIGCRRGTSQEKLELRLGETCERAGLDTHAIAEIATIDVKADEEGLIGLCKAYGVEMECFTADELNSQAGEFHSSEFVKKTVGTDNVCERAVAAAGGKLLVRRDAGEGVTMSIGILPRKLEWPH